MALRDDQLIPFLEITRLLHRMLAQIETVLGPQFSGMILHGSLATGDFTPGRSDIDFLVVTTSQLSPETVTQLAAMHRRVTAAGPIWAKILEGSYIPEASLRRHDPDDAVHPALRLDGSFDLDYHGSDWIIQRAIIRQHGVPLAGPQPAELIDPVPPADIRTAVSGILREWWQPMLTDTRRLQSSEYQAYAILTMCRSLYTFHHGESCTKPSAAAWAQTQLGPTWAPLIQQAAAWREGMPLDELHQVLELIRLTIKQCA